MKVMSLALVNYIHTLAHIDYVHTLALVDYIHTLALIDYVHTLALFDSPLDAATISVQEDVLPVGVGQHADGRPHEPPMGIAVQGADKPLTEVQFR